jgi:hypothetical protein
MRRSLPTEAATRPVGGPDRLGAASMTGRRPEAIALEPALTLADVCLIRRESRRTGERERSAGLWPKPDFYIGTGTRKSPRWRVSTIRAWIEQEGHI